MPLLTYKIVSVEKFVVERTQCNISNLTLLHICNNLERIMYCLCNLKLKRIKMKVLIYSLLYWVIDLFFNNIQPFYAIIGSHDITECVGYQEFGWNSVGTRDYQSRYAVFFGWCYWSMGCQGRTSWNVSVKNLI